MNDVDKRAIEKLAIADTYRGPEREPAIEAYERGLRLGELNASPHMRFMAEIVAPVPDLYLRSMYRCEVVALYNGPAR